MTMMIEAWVTCVVVTRRPAVSVISTILEPTEVAMAIEIIARKVGIFIQRIDSRANSHPAIVCV